MEIGEAGINCFPLPNSLISIPNFTVRWSPKEIKMIGHGQAIIQFCACYYWIFGVRITDSFVTKTEVGISDTLLYLYYLEQSEGNLCQNVMWEKCRCGRGIVLFDERSGRCLELDYFRIVMKFNV